MDCNSTAILIPSYKPDEKLITLVDALIDSGLNDIYIVDDGSGPEYRRIFDAIRNKTTVITHEVNRGKGAALRTGIDYIAGTNAQGIVTADCDGQHTPEDCIRIAEAMAANPDTLILGSRSISHMPLRSKVSNTLACFLFAALMGLRLSDTQTGLRGIPRSQFKIYSSIGGDRYEYETNMLIYAAKHNLKVKEFEIETIYIDNNASSHIRVIRDGFRVYGTMFKNAGLFCVSSVIAAVIDYAVFCSLLYAAGAGWLISQLCARTISSAVNYTFNVGLVFRTGFSAKSLFRYYSLAAFILLCACLGIKLLTAAGLNVLLSKIIIDAVLYVVNYEIQQRRLFIHKTGY